MSVNGTPLASIRHRANVAATTRRWRPAALALLAAATLSACAARPREIGREPELSPVGSGIRRVAPEHAGAHLEAGGMKDRFIAAAYTSDVTRTGSLWRDRGADLFRDARARRAGDILTVKISIKDKASLDNSSKRSRDSAVGMGLDFSHTFDLPGLKSTGSATSNAAVNSNTSTDGKGEIARSESIDLRLAAIVTGVLPNGNLVIEGSQEVRVNYELRVLMLSGIVDIADIQADNTVSYERVAEARMSYGGRGRSMEVQQPGWLHQITDLVAPF